ncbi:hypothetical protein RF11_12095 [Thelohanellus kitauei]|uniref:Uncharacterized protein n=1 Tax=Thelohanellus kitauei TaxID=669202 RepID=A0A0C2MG83_THEKT|nr:hypothetical protein RF11_12095 [Thelohanellus kitauei]
MSTNSKLNDWYFTEEFGLIEAFLRESISALRKETYIDKLKYVERLWMLEDVKTMHLSRINEDFINSIFSDCGNHLVHSFESKSSDGNGNDEFVKFKELMSCIIKSFNESNYIDADTADDFCLRLQSIEWYDPSDIARDLSIFAFWEADYIRRHNIEKNELYRRTQTFQILFRLFILIFEMKFIYKDIKSGLSGLQSIILP